MASIPEAPTLKARVYYIDQLRIVAILLVFVFHALRIFDIGDYHVKDASPAMWATVPSVFLNFWLMPLFFLLAGMSARLARPDRNPGAFIRDRALRLLVPFLAGVLVLVPPQDYLEYLRKGRFSGNFLEFLPAEAGRMLGALHFEPAVFGSVGHHVWFLPFLFIFGLLGLVLLKPLNDPAGHGMARLAAAARWAGFPFLAILPYALVYVLVRPLSPEYRNWADFIVWFLVYGAGFVIAAQPAFMDGIRRGFVPFLASGLAGFAAMLYFLARFGTVWFTAPDYSPPCLLFNAAWALTAWSWVMVALNLGRRFLDRPSPRLPYLNEAVLPFYLIHQPVVLVAGFLVVGLALPAVLKLLLVLAAAFLVVAFIYEAGIRRWNPVRFLLGMKPARKAGGPS